MVGITFMVFITFMGDTRAQNKCWSMDNVRQRWLFVRTKFQFGGHFDRSHTQLSNNYLEKIIYFIYAKYKQLN